MTRRRGVSPSRAARTTRRAAGRGATRRAAAAAEQARRAAIHNARTQKPTTTETKDSRMDALRQRATDLLGRPAAAFRRLSVLDALRYTVALVLFAAASLAVGLELMILFVGVGDLFGYAFFVYISLAATAAVGSGVLLLPSRPGRHAATRRRGKHVPPSREAMEQIFPPVVRARQIAWLEKTLALPERTPVHELKLRPQIPPAGYLDSDHA